MNFPSHISYSVPDKTYAGVIKREIHKIAETAGLDESQSGRVDIILSEMVSNLVKHNVTGAEIIVKVINDDVSKGLEIISLDNGPGMRDTAYMMTDGVSTYGSKGEGLGAIKRLSDDFDIYSTITTGTGILSRVFSGKKSAKSKVEFEINAVCVPYKGEKESGDAWGFKKVDNQYAVIAVDGLGHGIDAHSAAKIAVESFMGLNTSSPSEMLKTIHPATKRTRGAVAAISIIDFKNNQLNYCGIGNISGKIWSKDASKSLVSYNGTVGYAVPTKFFDHKHDWNGTNILILHSDGIKTRWEMSKYPGLENCDSSLIAAIIYKDNTRGTDDNLVVVGKKRKG